jgi:hypothetical protein
VWMALRRHEHMFVQTGPSASRVPGGAGSRCGFAHTRSFAS